MARIVTVMSGQHSVTLTILRVITGAILAYAGYSKLTGGGLGRGAMEKWGVIAPEITGPAITFLEFFGGIALIVGIFTRYVGLLFTIEFLVVVLLKLKAGSGFPSMWIDLMLVGSTLVLAASGAGMLAVDRGRRWDA